LLKDPDLACRVYVYQVRWPLLGSVPNSLCTAGLLSQLAKTTPNLLFLGPTRIRKGPSHCSPTARSGKRVALLQQPRLSSTLLQSAVCQMNRVE
jgi:hypothetical protein